ncbi:MAG: hypothetical protein IE916_00375 [Epsilonproteobacteria bacterium]|nr:hypothetical protein [Campylobacterota bacterium]
MSFSKLAMALFGFLALGTLVFGKMYDIRTPVVPLSDPVVPLSDPGTPVFGKMYDANGDKDTGALYTFDSQASTTTITVAGSSGSTSKPPTPPSTTITFSGGGSIRKWDQPHWSSDWHMKFYGVDDKICIAQRVEGGRNRNITCAKWDPLLNGFVIDGTPYGNVLGHFSRLEDGYNTHNTHAPYAPMGMTVENGKIKLRLENRLYSNANNGFYMGELHSFTPVGGITKTEGSIYLASPFATSLSAENGQKMEADIDFSTMEYKSKRIQKRLSAQVTFDVTPTKICLNLNVSVPTYKFGDYSPICIDYQIMTR